MQRTLAGFFQEMGSALPGISSLIVRGIPQILPSQGPESPTRPASYLPGARHHCKRAWQGFNLPGPTQTSLENVPFEPQGVQS